MLLERFSLMGAVIFASAGAASAQDFNSDGMPSPTSSLRRGGEGKAGTGSFEFQVGYFDMPDDGAGNPFLDEELTVIEPVLLFDYNTTDRFGYTIGLSYDNISSASIDRLSNFPDQSGASGDNYVGLDLGVHYDQTSRKTVGGNFHISYEYDYLSLGLGGSMALDAEDGNSTTTWNANVFYDIIDIIRFDGVEEGTDERITLSTTMNRSQAISPNTVGELGATLAFQSGFLETAYNAVVIEDPLAPPNPNLANMANGIETAEVLPDSRVRGAVFGKTRTYLGKDYAGELGGRIYADSWGITSLTFEPRLYKSFFDEALLLRLRYRYYFQTESTYYEDTFLVEESEQTQDSDLRDFDSHTLGLKLTWQRNPRHSFNVGFDFIKRDDDLDQTLGLIGWKWNF